MLETGMIITTQHGIKTTPVPWINTTTNRKINNSCKRVNQWAIENGIRIAKTIGNDFAAHQFSIINPKKPTQAEIEGLWYFLLDDK